jgi:hypothetical protein
MLENLFFFEKLSVNVLLQILKLIYYKTIF